MQDAGCRIKAVKKISIPQKRQLVIPASEPETSEATYEVIQPNEPFFWTPHQVRGDNATVWCGFLTVLMQDSLLGTGYSGEILHPSSCIPEGRNALHTIGNNVPARVCCHPMGHAGQ